MAAHAAADVVVTGAGLAGLACALQVRRLRPHARVMVLESQDCAGGSARWAVGSFTAGGTRWQRAAGVADTAADHYAEALGMCRIRRPDYRQLLAKVCERGPGLLDDLAGLGITFAGPYAEAPHTRPRMHNAVPDASAVTQTLADRAAGAGITILSGHEVTGIGRSEPGGYDIDASGRRFRAPQLVIASGDASAADPLFPAVNPGSTGEAAQLAASCLGAWLEHARLVPWLRTAAPDRPRVAPEASLVRAATVRLDDRELPGAQLLADPAAAGSQPLELVITADEAVSAATVACTYPATGYSTLAGLIDGGLARREDPATVVVGPLVMAITLADAGLVTDARLRVLDGGGSPLPGLHACGSAALGGISLGGHGHHLLWAAVTGELAGAQVAAQLP